MKVCRMFHSKATTINKINLFVPQQKTQRHKVVMYVQMHFLYSYGNSKQFPFNVDYYKMFLSLLYR